MELNKEHSMIFSAGVTVGPNTATKLEDLLDKHKSIFSVSKVLPPSRGVDHRITLKDEGSTFNQKPYRYSAP